VLNHYKNNNTYNGHLSKFFTNTKLASNILLRKDKKEIREKSNIYLKEGI